MMDRRRQSDDPNHEAWAIPYADLLTLMLAFFVVMYAISAVDAGKFHALSSSMVEAFRHAGGAQPIQIGDIGMDPDPISDELPRSLAPLEIYFGLADAPPGEIAPQSAPLDQQSPPQRNEESLPSAELARMRRSITEIAANMETSLANLIQEGVIQVTRRGYWLEIEINTKLLFPSGSATLAENARPVLADVATNLAGRPVRIQVEGHTDNVPIQSPQFPSNWELSSGRAASVVHLFANQGVDPRRMVAMGYGEYAPVATNTTEAGRARNRRVAILVLPELNDQDDQERGPERLRSDYRVLFRGQAPD